MGAARGLAEEGEQEVVAAAEGVLHLVEDHQAVVAAAQQALQQQVGGQPAAARQALAFVVPRAHPPGHQPGGAGDGLGELGLAGARRAVEQRVDPRRPRAGGPAERAAQAFAGVGQVGVVGQRPWRGCDGLDDHRQQVGTGLGGGEEDLVEEILGTAEILQVFPRPRRPDQAELAQGAGPAEDLLQACCRGVQRGGQVGEVVAQAVAAGLPQEGAEHRHLHALVDEVEDGGLGGIEARALGDQGHPRVGRAAAVLPGEARVHALRHPGQRVGQEGAHPAAARAAQVAAVGAQQKGRQPVVAVVIVVVDVASGGPLGLQPGEHRGVEQRQAQGPQGGGEVAVGEAAQQGRLPPQHLQGVAAGAAGFGGNGGEIPAPGRGLGRAGHFQQPPSVKGCRRRLSTCHTRKSPRCSPSSTKTPSATSRGSRK